MTGGLRKIRRDNSPSRDFHPLLAVNIRAETLKFCKKDFFVHWPSFFSWRHLAADKGFFLFFFFDSILFSWLDIPVPGWLPETFAPGRRSGRNPTLSR